MSGAPYRYDMAPIVMKGPVIEHARTLYMEYSLSGPVNPDGYGQKVSSFSWVEKGVKPKPHLKSVSPVQINCKVFELLGD